MKKDVLIPSLVNQRKADMSLIILTWNITIIEIHFKVTLGMGLGTYNYTYKIVVFESAKVKNVKIKKNPQKP